MKQYILKMTSGGVYENSKNPERDFIKEFSRPQRIVFAEEVDTEDGFVHGIITDLIKVPEKQSLESYMRKYVVENQLEQECWGVYETFNSEKEILTEADL